MGIGLLFPGQASQFPGMGKELHDAYPVAREVFREASEALGFSLADLCFRGSEEDLRRTENTQPSIFTVSVAAYRVLAEEAGIRPLCAAGHSLGEYSALVAAGALSLKDDALLARPRGKYMQEALPLGEGAMAAVIGLSPETVAAVCREAGREGVVEPSNYNGGGPGGGFGGGGPGGPGAGPGARSVRRLAGAARRVAARPRSACGEGRGVRLPGGRQRDGGTLPAGGGGGGNPPSSDRVPRSLGGVRAQDARHGSDVVPGSGAGEGPLRTGAQDREGSPGGRFLRARGPARRRGPGRMKFFLVRSPSLRV